jgi:glycerate dehydrogenase
MAELRTMVVVDGFTADQGKPVWEPLRRFGDVRVYPRTGPSEVVVRCTGASVVLTNKVVFDAATLDALPQLRYLGVTATGVNVVDLPACARRGIAVTNVPNYSTASVAQLVVALVLHFSQHVADLDARVKAGEWAGSSDFTLGVEGMTELAGKQAVIVGYGAIGQAVGRALAALGMEVVSAQVPGTTARADRQPLFPALARADVVSLHCPLTEATRGMVNAQFLAALKPTAILVNTARGPLVDEAALLATLRAGRLRGVALDVLSQEPPPLDHPLLHRTAPFANRVLVTPHIAWATEEARQRLVNESIRNVEAWLQGEVRNRVDALPRA